MVFVRMPTHAQRLASLCVMCAFHARATHTHTHAPHTHSALSYPHMRISCSPDPTSPPPVTPPLSPLPSPPPVAPYFVRTVLCSGTSAVRAIGSRLSPLPAARSAPRCQASRRPSAPLFIYSFRPLVCFCLILICQHCGCFYCRVWMP